MGIYSRFQPNPYPTWVSCGWPHILGMWDEKIIANIFVGCLPLPWKLKRLKWKRNQESFCLQIDDHLAAKFSLEAGYP
ncbi:hypothetical protein BDV40DRAFT_267192 [Aspergillus tamarii]|uniref:Uncharacterized protein n=1 Tax=Aspergillus tamarii TaxID=41984 RepID=A0A5N6USS8_ASPTM|nr:hypothetical protein BDV40DRAFT_267192 [Aspergillus tamarii]